MDNKKPTILVLGSDHFGNPNMDMFNTQSEDILTDKRQKEMRQVVDSLTGFQPTKIALEVSTKAQHDFNQDYLSYLYGDFKLTSDERHQIGFQLAKAMNLHELFAIDWNENVEGIPDLEALATESGSKVFEEAMEKGQHLANDIEDYLDSHTIMEFLRWLNEPTNVKANHELYMTLTLMESDNIPVGAMWTAQYWYYRNLIIYKNLVEMVTSNDDRVFVLYGVGHVHLLTQFLRESGRFHVETSQDYLVPIRS
ncbi:DUF5694 domain-containing protein [Ornithinibacillus californiensis]|uniref:DUF5694 domain-containing protein n=1 Tax=Ornithinibacillus californiensis TaxID=161536 RepID=UPI00064DF055|nr:DUF5694 domain-containing protein [Ornithinibacillus californiensis]